MIDGTFVFSFYELKESSQRKVVTRVLIVVEDNILERCMGDFFEEINDGSEWRASRALCTV